MSQFYVSIIFLGITLIVISLVWIVYDRKKSYDYVQQLEEKKNELVNIINDAEQMVEELNKFSDYIVTQMDLKNEELCTSLKSFDEKIKQINSRVLEKHEIKAIQADKVVNGISVGVHVQPEMPVVNLSSDLIIDSLNYESNNVLAMKSSKISSKPKDKVIPLNSRYKEVIQLAEKGLNETDIAKRLNLGKGEIRLVLEMNK